MAPDAEDRSADRVGLFQCSGDLTIAEVNLTACRLLGRRREELVDQPLDCFVVIEGPDLGALTRRLAVRGLDVRVVEAHLVDRHGALRPARLTLSSLPDRVEDPIAALDPVEAPLPAQDSAVPSGSFLVGLERRDDQEWHGEARRAAADGLADRARDLIVRYRLWPQPGFEYVSASSEDLLGYPPAAFYGDPGLLHHLLTEPSEMAELNAVYDGLWEPRKPITLHVRHRDGRVLALEQRPTAILDGERRVIAVESISRDVTERREEQVEYETVLGIRRLIDEALSGNLSAVDPVELLQAGVDAMCTYLGWPVGVAFMGEPEPFIVSPVAWHVADGERFGSWRSSADTPEWSSLPEQYGAWPTEGRVAALALGTVAGPARHTCAAAAGLTHAITVPVPSDAGIGAIIELFTEDNAPPEAAVVAALEGIAGEIGRMFVLSQTTFTFRRLHQLRQEFVERAAHELRGPVGSIALMASVLAGQAVDADPQRLATSLEALASQADRVRVVANHLLSLSQLEEGRVELHLEAVSVRQVAGSAVSSLLPEQAARSRLDIAADLKVMADAVLLDEVLANLLLNACRHGGPTVTVGATGVTDEVVITVSDDGPGLPESLVATLFRPIRQPLVTQQKGGLGLSLVRQMMVTMGGEVTYEPAQSGGACFVLRLPRA